MIVTVDVGGTKTLIADFDTSGKLGPEVRFQTPEDQSEFVDTLLKTLQDQYTAGDISAIVIGLPGIISPDGTLLSAPNLGWKDLNLKQTLAVFYSCPILIENDANLAGLAEANSLEKPVPLCLYITLSTGIGTGIITNGKLDEALSQSESGHMVLSFKGKPNNWEEFGSGKAIREAYGKLAAEINDPKTWQEICEQRFAPGFLALIPALQPDVIVIGGSIGTYFERFQAPLEETLKKQLPPFIALPTIAQAQHPEEAVIYGCYYYAIHKLNL